ncbi:hypothetical protein [Planctomyces sp. SH-PL62]|uniref:hypothetical protein n=1 Tax=Planctomyces sp. SH-PL62 TaxID=1636152 RepID=UPI00078D88AE|nr:hypothetical protein [Planctomyces sp. SH-PL62]AMV35811.1 hypothetical protein VT85_00105 [Planctomyces sp. SH-PL62]
MKSLLIVLCILLSAPALFIGAVGSGSDRPFLIAGAILLGSATIATAIPKDETPRGRPKEVD